MQHFSTTPLTTPTLEKLVVHTLQVDVLFSVVLRLKCLRSHSHVSRFTWKKLATQPAQWLKQQQQQQQQLHHCCQSQLGLKWKHVVLWETVRNAAQFWWKSRYIESPEQQPLFNPRSLIFFFCGAPEQLLLSLSLSVSVIPPTCSSIKEPDSLRNPLKEIRSLYWRMSRRMSETSAWNRSDAASVQVFYGGPTHSPFSWHFYRQRVCLLCLSSFKSLCRGLNQSNYQLKAF